MSKQIILRQASSIRQTPLLNNQSSSGNSRFAEVAGGTTASCAALCCCCPCGLVNLLVLAIYKVPAGLCRRALRKKRHQKMMKQQQRRHRCSCGYEEAELQIHPVMSVDIVKSQDWEESEKAVMELEKEMWDRFYSTGFWRSPSQREPPTNSSTIVSS
ncbi:hypothetical protein FNV43_RR16698 [Rhamnella rubrinervis]|uniref:Uncharacterized protein n=1 Tax=Rhamnella rubrinervis TaxID=2594499 RepID=A0A8K0GZB0_9ROSA|nr:hypothetical protein FNV43_RR16698 [Rhamnella rubrinervis]